MDWTNLNIFVAAMFMTTVTAVAGSVVVFGGWIADAGDGEGSTQEHRPIPLYLFTAGFVLNLLGIPVVWFAADDSKSMAWAIVLLTAAGLIVAGVVLDFFRRRKTGRGLSRIGSVIVAFANAAGGLVLVSSLLGMKLH